MLHQSAIQQYLQSVKRANTEEAKKTQFYLLLGELFKNDPDAMSIVK